MATSSPNVSYMYSDDGSGMGHPSEGYYDPSQYDYGHSGYSYV